MKLKIFFFLALFVSFGFKNESHAYPLNGFEQTGIMRLEGYFYSLYTKSGKENFVPGALLSMGEVGLRLDGKSLEIPPVNSEVTRQILQSLGSDANGYSFSFLDISDPKRPIYAAHNERSTFIPGSVGKIIVALAFFQTLADIYPKEINVRENVLRSAMLTADSIIVKDPHEVPFWFKDEGKIEFRPLQIGDRGNLWTFLDYMLSASSNAAGSMVMRELVLLKHFGKAYPVSPGEAQRYLAKASKGELAGLLSSTIRSALTRNGINPALLFQSSLFTKAGQEAIPAKGSIANTRELVRFMLLMEQGKLVDKFSSLEMKRLLYVTQQRVRYASSPSLDFAAVYYKSGSLYKCRPEAHFSCEKYHGNLLNLMNSVAVVEYPAGNPKFHYIIAVNSNVLRKDSAETHAKMAALIQKIIQGIHK